LIATINKHVITDNQGIGICGDDGVHSQSNGVDIHQTPDYVKLSCVTYIKQVLQTCGWKKPATQEPDLHAFIC
jgi:hypothetical protein